MKKSERKQQRADRKKGFEPRRYSEADESFARRLRQGFRMMKGKE